MDLPNRPGRYTPRTGANVVNVPTYLYKLVYDATTQKAWAHWQQNREGETVSRPISYQELVNRTGVEFLPRKCIPALIVIAAK